MIVPRFWAEARLQHRQAGQQTTVRRFGWSDVSVAEAQAHAEQRAADALRRLQDGAMLRRREPKRPYNGASGVPIREEIVSRHGETIVTRNSYGARCLNTPDVLFADVDFGPGPSLRVTAAAVVGTLLVAGAAAWAIGSRTIGLALLVAALPVGLLLARVAYRLVLRVRGGAEGLARRRARRFVAQHPDWNLRLYRTPAGLRVLVTHRPFDPAEPQATALFRALQADPRYVAMCRHQQCFRARVSAKPWRIGIASHLRPRPGVWPVEPQHLPLRQAWIAQYERAADAYSACAFLENVGSGTVHPRVRPVLDLHDELCAATRRRPIA